MAKTFRIIWGGLALLTALWMGSVLINLSTVAERIDVQSVDADLEVANDIGIAIGGGISVVIVGVCGLPILFFFLFLFWRNGVKLQNDRKHQETLHAIEQAGQKDFHPD